jgi:hypothetical protein
MVYAPYPSFSATSVTDAAGKQKLRACSILKVVVFHDGKAGFVLKCAADMGHTVAEVGSNSFKRDILIHTGSM